MAFGRIDPVHARGAAMALASAFLFGASTPCSKILLRSTGPLTLAGLLYAGAGATLLLILPLRRRDAVSAEAGVRRSDVPLLSAAIACGALLGPALMMFGLERTSAVAGSLLLNLEPPFTMLIAVLVFGEHLGRRQAAAGTLIVLGTALVGWRAGSFASEGIGVIAIGFACLAWSIDTNLSQRLSLRDPVAIGGIKGITGGVVLLGLALAAGERLPGAGTAVAGLALGAVAYGASMILIYRALRELGAARVAAYFATAPFAGAIAAVAILREPLRAADAAAMVLMAAGVALLLHETHEHEHAHEEMTHEHAHEHDDEHHRHEHAAGEPAARRHSHPHRHAPTVHAHPHAPDLHHRHPHGPADR